MYSPISHLIDAAREHSDGPGLACEALVRELVGSQFGQCVLLLNPRAASVELVLAVEADRGELAGQVFCAFSDAAKRQAVELSLASVPPSASVLYFVGSLQILLGCLEFSPTLIWEEEGGCGDGLDEALAATYLRPGMPVLAGVASSLIGSWVNAGLVVSERLPFGGRWECWLTTQGCTGRFAGPSSAVFQVARFALQWVHTREIAGDDGAAIMKAIESPWSGSERLQIDRWPYQKPAERLPSKLPEGRDWPKISIITPSFEQGAFLEENILSVINQGYPNVEHIVIDGGSTDQTAAVLAAYRHQLSHVISLPNEGQGNAINKGMALATGEILTWLNSDDRLAPGALGAVALAFAKSGADMVAGICQILRDGEIVDQHLTSCPDGPLPLDDLLELDECWQAGQFFYQPEVFFTRAIWTNCGGHVREDLHYSMDYDLWVRFAEGKARLHTVGRPIAQFRRHERRKTHEGDGFLAELRRYVAQRNPAPFPRRRSTWPLRPQLRAAMVNDHEFQFGAGIAHGRLAWAMGAAGVEVTVHSLVDVGHPERPLPITTLVSQVQQAAPDFIVLGNLHAVSPPPSAWLVNALGRIAPTLILLHDFWQLTGRCAYPGTCEMYLTGCDHRCPTATEYPALAPERIAAQWTEKRLALIADPMPLLVANSAWGQNFARSAVESFGRPGPRVERISLSVPLETFRPRARSSTRQRLGLAAESFLVVTSGESTNARKGLSQVVRVMELLSIPDATLLILGYVSADHPGLPAGTLCPGYIADAEQLALYMAAADVFVGGSLEETFGQVYMEAAACGTPVVAFAGSGVNEAVIEGWTGLLVPHGSEASMAAAVRQLYHSPAYRQRLGGWARLYAECYWSAAFSYRSLHLALRRAGLLPQIGASVKIAFNPELEASPSCIRHDHGSSLRPKHNVGPREGPLPEYGLPVFHWAYGPACQFTFRAIQPGPSLLFVRYRNTIPEQVVTVQCNGKTAAEEPLRETGLGATALLIVEATLEEGANEFTFSFKRWSTSAEDARPLALIIEHSTVLRIPT